MILYRLISLLQIVCGRLIRQAIKSPALYGAGLFYWSCIVTENGLIDFQYTVHFDANRFG